MYMNRIRFPQQGNDPLLKSWLKVTTCDRSHVIGQGDTL